MLVQVAQQPNQREQRGAETTGLFGVDEKCVDGFFLSLKFLTSTFQDPRLARYGKHDPQEWQGSFRMRAKRETTSKRDGYDLHEAKSRITPLGGVAKLVGFLGVF